MSPHIGMMPLEYWNWPTWSDPVICWYGRRDRKSTRLNSSHVEISYAVFCLKKKKKLNIIPCTVQHIYHLYMHSIKERDCTILPINFTRTRSTYASTTLSSVNTFVDVERTLA